MDQKFCVANLTKSDKSFSEYDQKLGNISYKQNETFCEPEPYREISSYKQDQTSRPDPEVIKLFSCSTQLSMKFILLINVKIVGILTFSSRINTASENFNARNILIFQHFSFYKQLKFHAQLS